MTLPILALLLACGPDDSKTPVDSTDPADTDTPAETDTPIDEGDDTDAAPDSTPRGTPGTLDPSFGDGGVVTLPLSAGDDSAHDVEIADDGALYVTTRTWDPAGLQVLKLLPDGTLDEGFGDGGRVSLTDSPDALWSPGGGLALRTGGGVLCGWADGDRAWVTALDAAGEPVPGFGTDGTATLAMDTLTFSPQYATMVVDADGRPILVASDATRSAVVKFTAGGVPDPTWATAGKRLLSDFYALNAAFDDQARLLVVGEVAGDRAAARVLPGGDLDPAFDTDGIRVYTGEPPPDFFMALEMLPGGGFVATNPLLTSRLELYDDAGAPQTSFDEDGRISITPGNATLAIAGDTDLVAAGGVGPAFEIYRFDLATGALVTAFSDDGIAQVQVGLGDSVAFHSAIDARQRLVLAGITLNTNYDLVLTRVWL